MVSPGINRTTRVFATKTASKQGAIVVHVLVQPPLYLGSWKVFKDASAIETIGISQSRRKGLSWMPLSPQYMCCLGS